MGKPSDMNGLWSGTYTYEQVDQQVVFSAWFDDRSGALAGTISEANTFVQNNREELDATLTGVRDGLIVDFTKIYTRSSGAHQTPIHYEGEANAAFTIVRGIWHFRPVEAWSGSFTLSRVSGGLEQAVTRARLVKTEP